jgi:hypothetical protein
MLKAVKSKASVKVSIKCKRPSNVITINARHPQGRSGVQAICGITWGHCNSIIMRLGRTIEVTNINEGQARVGAMSRGMHEMTVIRANSRIMNVSKKEACGNPSRGQCDRLSEKPSNDTTGS